MSQESGISTFRDSGGLWENHRIEDVASPDGFARNPKLVLSFYNARRQQLKEVKPNPGHVAISNLQADFEVQIITQNVDDLHERAGSKNVLHLHGELRKARSTKHSDLIYEWHDDLHIGDLCEYGSQLRPHIVWFGEAVPNILVASEEVQGADLIVIIGTSLQVYPAAGLIFDAPEHIPIVYIDPQPNQDYSQRVIVLKEKASSGMIKLMEILPKLFNRMSDFILSTYTVTLVQHHDLF